MNLLEQYIKEVISEEPYTTEWTKEFDKEFVKVKVTTNCYGSEKTVERIFDIEKWEQAKKQGYFME